MRDGPQCTSLEFVCHFRCTQRHMADSFSVSQCRQFPRRTRGWCTVQCYFFFLWRSRLHHQSICYAAFDNPTCYRLGETRRHGPTHTQAETSRKHCATQSNTHTRVCKFDGRTVCLRFVTCSLSSASLVIIRMSCLRNLHFLYKSTSS